MGALIKQGSIAPIGTIRRAMSHPATPQKGDPCRYGEIVGTALTDEDSDGETTLLIHEHITAHSVRAVDGAGNSPVAIGDKLFYVDADTPPLSKKATGRYAGTAEAVIATGVTATIDVFMKAPV